MKCFAAVLLWAVLVGSGFYKLLSYGATPGEAGEAPRFWPKESGLFLEQGMSRLVISLHPHCGCSRASLGELAIIMGKFKNKVSADVLFYSPSNISEDWVKSDLWYSAQSIPGVQTIIDQDGNKAKLFQAKTSGQTLLYDPQGKLIFSGGITSSRGHSGDNVGRDAITALLSGEKPDLQKTFVFGCQIFRPNNKAGENL